MSKRYTNINFGMPMNFVSDLGCGTRNNAETLIS